MIDIFPKRWRSRSARWIPRLVGGRENVVEGEIPRLVEGEIFRSGGVVVCLSSGDEMGVRSFSTAGVDDGRVSSTKRMGNGSSTDVEGSDLRVVLRSGGVVLQACVLCFFRGVVVLQTCVLCEGDCKLLLQTCVLLPGESFFMCLRVV